MKKVSSAQCGGFYLMVPVGDGSGEPKALMCSWCCCAVGMQILRGEIWGRSGRGGGDGCSFSLCSSASRRDMNWILMTVLGKRNTHLGRGTEGRGDGGKSQDRRRKRAGSHLFILFNNNITIKGCLYAHMICRTQIVIV